MKTWKQGFIRFLVIFVLAFVFSACEGTMGPQGEQGQQGNSWQPDNTIESDYQPTLSSWLPVMRIDTVDNIGIYNKSPDI